MYQLAAPILGTHQIFCAVVLTLVAAKQGLLPLCIVSPAQAAFLKKGASSTARNETVHVEQTNSLCWQLGVRIAGLGTYQFGLVYDLQLHEILAVKGM